MIQISRDLVGRLQRVFRKAAKKDGRRSPILVFQADRTGLVIHCHSTIAVEYRLSGYFPECRFGLPFSALADFAGRDIMPVTLAPFDCDIVATWSDAGIPQRRSYSAMEADKLPSIEALPETSRIGDKGTLATFAEACRSAASERSRYALECLCLRGSAGQIVATNGSQLLVVGELAFPWKDDVLVPAHEVLGCRDLPADRPVEVARTENHVVVSVGPWTIWLPIEKEARFPRVEDVIPDHNFDSTHLQLSENDRQFLCRSLPKLPVTNEMNRPVTIDCNGHVAIRSLSEDGHCTELTLSASKYTGDQTRLITNRDLLRAVELGFTELHLHGNKRPIVGRDGRRQYVWQPLTGSPVESRPDAAHIVSDSRDEPVAITPSVTKEIPLKNEPKTRETVPEPQAAVASNVPNARTDAVADLIDEAEEIKRMLRDTTGRLNDLIIKLRGHRRQAKAVQSTLASLRQLEHVAG